MVITVKRGKSNKMHVYLDGEYTATTGVEKWLTCGYHSGDDISESEWVELHSAFYFDRIYSAALELLSRRDHSRRELSDKLYQRFVVKPFVAKDIRESEDDYAALNRHGVDKTMVTGQIDAVCDKLTEQGLLNDERYARLYAEELIRTKSMGLVAVKNALAKRGIDRYIIADVCDSLEFDASESIKTILASRYKRYDLYDEAHMAKIINALQRKGYKLSEIRQAYYEYLEDYESPE